MYMGQTCSRPRMRPGAVIPLAESGVENPIDAATFSTARMCSDDKEDHSEQASSIIQTV